MDDNTMTLYAATKHLDEQLCRCMFDPKDESAIRSVLDALNHPQGVTAPHDALEHDREVVQEGWALVPVEPNPEMWTAGAVELERWRSETGYASKGDAAVLCHRAMLAAAPPAPSPWRPIGEARKDGSTIWAMMRRDMPGNFAGIQLPLRHPGLADDGFDVGWNIAAPVGHGGFSDEWIAGWISLPTPPVAEKAGEGAEG